MVGATHRRRSTAAGTVVADGLHGPNGRYRMITGVRRHGDHLWLGSLTGPGVARVPLW
ncbi:hypothetical protein [Micromonospora chokoriensis]|uniref:hypothetical protein n=1 Tax=Micromonospora chokoriensis TaxID=356851 RepID=UPI001E29EEAB|nr:hypothetical protein [Micromonospora chokoriensis]